MGVDMRAAAKGPQSSKSAFVAVDDRLAMVSCETLCLIGNHELGNFSRGELSSGLGGHCRFVEPETGCFYYQYAPPQVEDSGWSFLILDAYEISVFLEGPGGGIDPRAVMWLREHNPNFQKFFDDHPTGKTPADLDGNWWFNGVTDEAQRHSPVNGGMTSEQLAWLEGKLCEASEAGLRVGIFSHAIVHPGCSNCKTLIWNYEDVLRILHDSRLGQCVQFVFCGHQHEGGFFTDEYGIHHLCFTSPLFCGPEDEGAHARVEVRRDEVRVVGFAPILTEHQQRASRGGVLVSGGQLPSERILPFRETKLHCKDVSALTG